MGVDKQRKIDHEVKEIHTQVRKSSLILRQRIKDVQAEMSEYDSLGGMTDGESEEYPC